MYLDTNNHLILKHNHTNPQLLEITLENKNRLKREPQTQDKNEIYERKTV